MSKFVMPRKRKVLKDYYIGNEKRPSIKKGQKWLVDEILFSEQLGFPLVWSCKRLGMEVYMNKTEVMETFGVLTSSSIDM